ncbi:MAG: Peptidase M15 [Bacteriophage sp.]|nr:MAG: Peptidase M15 [Bacteriophage sp.]
MSAHVLGEGCDFTSPDVSAEDIRKLIAENEDKLPYKIRLEKDVNWVHVDCYDNSDNKISYFKA